MIECLKIFVPDKEINEQIDKILYNKTDKNNIQQEIFDETLLLEQELSRLLEDITDDETLLPEQELEELFEKVSLDAAELIGKPIAETSPEKISSEIHYRDELKKFMLTVKITGEIDFKKNLLSVNHIVLEIYKKVF